MEAVLAEQRQEQQRQQLQREKEAANAANAVANAKLIATAAAAAAAAAGRGPIKTLGGFHGNGNNSDHMFYVYPRYSQPAARSYWDTCMSAREYCTNHRSRGSQGGVTAYECLGHA